MAHGMRRVIGDESGIALVMALGILVVMSIMVVTVIDYTSGNQRSANYSKTRVTAFDASDAGMNDALAVLNLPTNNALDPDILPACHTANPDTTTPGTTNPTWFGSQTNFRALTSWSSYVYGSATSYWCGDFDKPNAQWFLWSTGSLRNPTGPSAAKVRRLRQAERAMVPVVDRLAQKPHRAECRQGDQAIVGGGHGSADADPAEEQPRLGLPVRGSHR